MSETLYGLFVAIALLLAYRLLDHPGAWTAAALGASIGAATLVRGEGILFVFLLALPVAWRGGRPGRVLRMGVTVLATVLVLAPWTIRNHFALDAFVPISTNESTLVAGANCADTYRGEDLGYWRLECISKRRRGATRPSRPTSGAARAAATPPTTWAAWSGGARAGAAHLRPLPGPAPGPLRRGPQPQRDPGRGRRLLRVAALAIAAWSRCTGATPRCCAALPRRRGGDLKRRRLRAAALPPRGRDSRGGAGGGGRRRLAQAAGGAPAPPP